MKKEKQVRSYQRRTKSGKVITVRAHTSCYEASDRSRKTASSRKGAGEEIVSKMRKRNMLSKDAMSVPKSFTVDGKKYITTSKIKWHTENDGESSYRVATVTAKSKDGKSIRMYKYDKQGRKAYGMPNKWNKEFGSEG